MQVTYSILHAANNLPTFMSEIMYRVASNQPITVNLEYTVNTCW